MTKMLASVSSVEEAEIAFRSSVDIIDLKNPARGSLGAMEIKLIKRIVESNNNKYDLSATIGDLPMDPEKVLSSVISIADTGVDYLKIGFFPGGDWLATINRLKVLTKQSYRLIAVLFAEQPIQLKLLGTLKDAGFTGVMLDTMNKNKGALTDLLTLSQIAEFINSTQKNKLLSGLAGSLRIEDIPTLTKFHPDYLGFRGALCMDNNRTSQMNEEAVNRVKQAIEFSKSQDREVQFLGFSNSPISLKKHHKVNSNLKTTQ